MWFFMWIGCWLKQWRALPLSLNLREREVSDRQFSARFILRAPHRSKSMHPLLRTELNFYCRMLLSFIFTAILVQYWWAGRRSRYSDCLRAGRSGDRIPVRRDFPHQSRPALGPTQPSVQWVPGLSGGVRCCRGVTLTPHPLLVQRSKIE